MTHNKFTIGLAASLIGFGIGLLTAPRSGRQSRQLVRDKWHRKKDRAHDVSTQMRAAYNDNKGDVADSWHRSQREVHELGSEARIRTQRIIDDARKTGHRIKEDIRARLSSGDSMNPRPLP